MTRMNRRVLILLLAALVVFTVWLIWIGRVGWLMICVMGGVA